MSPSSNFKPIAEYQETDILNAVEEINETTYLIKKNLRKKIKMYEKLMGTDMQNDAFENITEVFEKVDNTLGFKIYKRLINLSHLNDGKGITGIDEAFKFVDQFPNASVQWPMIFGFYLFDYETEKQLIHPGQYTIPQEKFWGNLKFYSTVDDITITKLMTPEFNVRRNDHWKLFLNLMVAECLDLEPIYEYYNFQDPSKKINKQKGFIIEQNGKKIDIRLEIRKLFKMVFNTTKEEILSQNKINKDFPYGENSLDPSNPVWIKLGEAANKLTSSIKSLKNEFPIIIANIKEDQNNYIYPEIRDFLKSVGEFDEKVFPARAKIEGEPGGQGLVKRISKAGGMEKVKENYPKWIFNQLKAEDDAKNPKNALPSSGGTEKIKDIKVT